MGVSAREYEAFSARNCLFTLTATRTPNRSARSARQPSAAGLAGSLFDVVILRVEVVVVSRIPALAVPGTSVGVPRHSRMAFATSGSGRRRPSGRSRQSCSPRASSPSGIGTACSAVWSTRSLDASTGSFCVRGHSPSICKRVRCAWTAERRRATASAASAEAVLAQSRRHAVYARFRYEVPSPGRVRSQDAVVLCNGNFGGGMIATKRSGELEWRHHAMLGATGARILHAKRNCSSGIGGRRPYLHKRSPPDVVACRDRNAGVEIEAFLLGNETELGRCATTGAVGVVTIVAFGEHGEGATRDRSACADRVRLRCRIRTLLTGRSSNWP